MGDEPTMSRLAIGLPVGISVARLISSRLFGLSAADPVTMAVAVAVVVVVALLAGYLPAHRASGVDPLVLDVAIRD